VLRLPQLDGGDLGFIVLIRLAMPRRSSTDNIVPLKTAKKRPDPPDRMTAAESRIWRAFVDDAPGGWFGPAAQVLLRQVVTTVVAADRHARRLRQMAAEGAPLETELMVQKAHRDATKAMIVGMTSLRLTPRSRVDIGVARHAFAVAPAPGLKPWDIEASGEIEDAPEGSDAGPAA
jgi:hypothetical protein